MRIRGQMYISSRYACREWWSLEIAVIVITVLCGASGCIPYCGRGGDYSQQPLRLLDAEDKHEVNSALLVTMGGGGIGIVSAHGSGGAGLRGALRIERAIRFNRGDAPDFHIGFMCGLISPWAGAGFGGGDALVLAIAPGYEPTCFDVDSVTKTALWPWAPLLHRVSPDAASSAVTRLRRIAELLKQGAVTGRDDVYSICRENLGRNDEEYLVALSQEDRHLVNSFIDEAIASIEAAEGAGGDSR